MFKKFIDDYQKCRSYTEKLCTSFEIEDYVLQNAPHVSPTKWHLAHTSWFFEQFILIPFSKDYVLFNEKYLKLFNSYYNTFGKFWNQAERGALSRPTVKEIYNYRHSIDKEIQKLLENAHENESKKIIKLLEIGIHHEQQHQELMLMDIKYNFSMNPLFPILNNTEQICNEKKSLTKFMTFNETKTSIGTNGEYSFCYDNETPKHDTHITSFEISNNLVTNEDYLEFITSGEYENADHWYSDGNKLRLQGKQGIPLYWRKIENKWYEYDLNGLQPLNLKAPVKHISFYEASAYASSKNCRLPTEYEWELAASLYDLNSKEADFHLNLWQWTSSNYKEYPGYKKPEGALGEYNQKFMINQLVLRGGCKVTPKNHYRKTYRNFYYPDQKWMYSGLRLAREKK